ncbi:MAG: hypothetical protein HC933_20530 [Pleurocapsa sp. SU_196_0]|nr:hypothetical protein [Pleurocapsa sp. SU_196_0]
MPDKDKFNQDEWFNILSAPSSAGSYVMASSPSGLTGLVAEAQGIVRGMLELSDASSSPFVQEVAQSLKPGADDLVSPPRENFKTLEEAKERMLNRVRQAVFLVDSRVDADNARAYKALVMGVALKVSEAATEGGFLGMGGTRVSEQEQVALEDLRGLLGM